MGPKAYKFALATIGGLLVLSAMPGTGALIGLFFAFSIAFFMAPLAFGLQSLIGASNLPASPDHMIQIVLFAYYVLIAIGLFRAFQVFAKGNTDRGRSISAKSALFAALPIAGYFSLHVLAREWR